MANFRAENRKYMQNFLYSILLVLGVTVTAPAWSQDFSAKEIDVKAKDGLAMGATLTYPAEGESKAVLVLATGSGVQNRDEEIMGKKPFKTLAEFLSSHGFAVLRIDDRGFTNPEDAKIATFDTYTRDVASAVALADSLYPAIPVGIIGHSCGGSYAIRLAAARHSGVDFIITLAAPAWSGDSLIMSQSRAIATQLTGRWDAEPLQRRIMSIAKSAESDSIAGALITTTLYETVGEAAKLPLVQQQIRQQVAGVLSPWYRSMLRYHPAEDIASVKVPFLALNGSKDMQVLPLNLSTIKELNPKAETRLMENHNHLFQPCQTGMMQEYAVLPGDFSDSTLQIILEWLNKIVKN